MNVHLYPVPQPPGWCPVSPGTCAGARTTSTAANASSHSHWTRQAEGDKQTICQTALSQHSNQTWSLAKSLMYIYRALINALNTQIIHFNLNTIFHTYVEDSPTKTIYIRHYIWKHTRNDCSRNWVFILAGAEIL